MGEFIKNDKALVIVAVFGITVIYMGLSAFIFKTIDASVLTPSLTGLFGVAVGQRLRAADNVAPPFNGAVK